MPKERGRRASRGNTRLRRRSRPPTRDALPREPEEVQQEPEDIQQEPEEVPEEDHQGLEQDSANFGMNQLLDIPPPPMVPSVSDQLGDHVHASVKEKIWKNEYLDLGVLSDLDPELGMRQNVVFINGSLQLRVAQAKSKVNNIEEWTNAFLIYTSIYLVKWPERAQELIKYMSTVRFAAKNFNGFGWKNYDVQFRLRQARNPLRTWSSIDHELWQMFVSAAYSTARSTSNTSSPAPSSKCYAFNYEGVCHRTQCSYSHTCIRCSGNHAAVRCWASNKAGPSQNFRPRQSHNPQMLRGTNQNNFRFRSPGSYQMRPRTFNQKNMGVRQFPN
ncbi:uncharacterized protein LOC117334012 [Pecten maximus]|uniref:uncharacterized protein LOC117334012 n=1 Tax=Pecten maximus TaxID=6579 RepID=UPI001458931C|nr:uncharacterized protein LOC117334012 [Pecten maximus]